MSKAEEVNKLLTNLSEICSACKKIRSGMCAACRKYPGTREVSLTERRRRCVAAGHVV